MTTETYAGAADAVTARAEPPYYAIIHPWSAVTFVHGKPTLADLQRAVGGDIEPLPIDIIQTHGEAITATATSGGRSMGCDPTLRRRGSFSGRPPMSGACASCGR